MNSDALSTILSIIEYSGNKELFVKDFFDIAIKRAFATFIQNKSPEEQEKLQQQFAAHTTPEPMQQLIDSYLQQGEYADLLNITLKDLLYDFLQTIYPTLSDAQKQKLDNYITSVTITASLSQKTA